MRANCKRKPAGGPAFEYPFAHDGRHSNGTDVTQIHTRGFADARIHAPIFAFALTRVTA